jgi:hypothetical protein
MRVSICKVDDPEAAIYLNYAARSGLIPRTERIGRENWYFVEVLAHGQVFQASDAVFRKMPDGNYIFKDGLLYYEEYV